MYWLTALGKALDEGNIEAAGKAVAELRRLGIDVSCRFVPRFEQEAAHA